MKKKAILVILLVFIMGFTLGTISNCIIQANEIKINKAIIKGFLVGIISIVIYYFYIICYKRLKNDAINIITLNLLAPLVLCASIIKVIQEYSIIPLDFLLVYFIIFLYSILIIIIANYIVKKSL